MLLLDSRSYDLPLAANAPLNRGLLGWWRASGVGNKGYFRDLMNRSGRIGTDVPLINAATWVAGRSASTRALRCDGSERGARITCPTYLRLARPLHISGWLRSNGTSPSNYAGLFGISYTNYDSVPYESFTLGNSDAGYLRGYSNNSGLVWLNASSYAISSFTNWTHVAFEVSGTNGYIYVNGIQVASGYSSGSSFADPTYGTAQLTIGASTPGTSRNINCDIDDVRIANRYYGEDGIKQLYHASRRGWQQELARPRRYWFPAAGGGPTDIAGACDLIFAAGSSTLAGSGALVGACALTFGAGSSTATGSGTLAGSATLTFAAGSSTLAGAGTLAGSAALTFDDGSSALSGAGTLAGSAAQVFGAGSSTLTATGALAGSAAITFSGSGSTSGTMLIAGTCAISFAAGSSTLLGSGSLAGTAANIFGAGTTTLTGAGALAGAAANVFGAGSSTLLGAGTLAGSTAAVFGAGSSTLLGAGALAGSAALTFSGSAATGGTVAIAGACDLTFGAGSSTLAAAGTLAGSAALVFSGGSSTLAGAGALSGASAMMLGAGPSTLLGSGVLAGTAGLTLGESAVLLGTGAIAGTSVITIAATAAIEPSVHPPIVRSVAWVLYESGSAQAVMYEPESAAWRLVE